MIVYNERLSAMNAGKEEGSADQLRKQIRSLRIENQKLHTEMAQIRVQLKILQEEPGPSKAHGSRAHKETPAPTQGQERASPSAHMNYEQMEIQEEANEGTAPSPPMRPPIKGVAKAMSEYPPGIEKEEDRRVYDDLTSRIQSLVSKRGEFMKGIKNPEKFSPSTSQIVSLIPVKGAKRDNLNRPATQSKTEVTKPSTSGKNKKGKKLNRDINPLKKSDEAGPNKKGTDPLDQAPDNAATLPPRNTEVQETISWAKVVGRRERKAQKAGTSHPPPKSGFRGKVAASSPLLSTMRG